MIDTGNDNSRIPKAIFFDVDGTLLTNGRVPQSTPEALRYAKDRGVMLFIATGRHKLEIEEIPRLNGMGFDGFVSMNGGFCYAGDEIIHKCVINKKAVRLVVEYISQNECTCMFNEADKMYINRVDEKVIQINNALGLSVPPVGDPLRAIDAEIYQMVDFGGSMDMEFLNNLPDCTITCSATHTNDIVPSSVNKWEGIERVIARFGIKSNETAAIGDGPNDIEMLIGAGFSVAM